MAFSFKLTTEKNMLLYAIKSVINDYNKNVNRLNESVKKGINKVEYPNINFDIESFDEKISVNLKVKFNEGTESYKNDIN